KIIIDLEDEVASLLEKQKANLEIIESLKSKGFESSENVSFESENQTENDCLVVEKEYDKEENLKVIAHGMFKLNVSHYVSPISMSKSSCDSNNVEIKLKRKRQKRKSSKQNVKQVYNDVSCANNDFVYFSDLDTFSSVRRPKNTSVIWKKKGSSNTSNVALSAVSDSNLNKIVKRYSRKDLLACNNSHIGETSSAYMCNDAMNVSYDSRMNGLLDDNNFFIFDDESVKIFPVSKMPFRKKPCDFMIVRSKSNMNKYLPRTVHCLDLSLDHRFGVIKAYDGRSCKSFGKRKINLETIESLKSKGFKSSETVISKSKNEKENDCLVVEKECDNVENSMVIAPGMFKLNVSQCASPISMSKSSCDSTNVEIKLKTKRRKRKSSKQNVKQVDNDVSRANNDFVHFSDLDTLVVLEDLRIAV
nr:hypothetical protein [Tanacetum cinerariifolium]